MDVEARVLSILQLPPEQQLSEGFSAERVEGGLRVVLRTSDGSLIGERLLPADGSCDELAQATAVVLSAWLSDVHPDFSAQLPVASAEPSSPPPPEPPAAPPPPPPPEPAPQSPREANRPAAPAPPITTHRWEGALGLGVDFVPRSVVPAAVLTLGLEPTAQGLGLRITTLAPWTRENGLGSGQVAWRRWPVAVGPSVRLTAKGLRWDLAAGIAAGWLHLEGHALDQPKTVDDLVLGGLLSARLSGGGKSWTPLVTAALGLWPAASVAFVAGSQAELRLPAADFLLAAGLSWAP